MKLHIPINLANELIGHDEGLSVHYRRYGKKQMREAYRIVEPYLSIYTDMPEDTGAPPLEEALRLLVRQQEEIMERHAAARQRAMEISGQRWAPLDPTLPRRIGERMLKRVIAALRDARHGGTIIFVPEASAAGLLGDDLHLDLKYPFEEGRSQFHSLDLIVDILNRLAQLYGGPVQCGSVPVGWREFEATTDESIATLDEALFEMAHLTAGLALADGAVVLSKRHELLGFGAMISGRLPAVRSVARALDLEGERFAEEATANVGARHRSAYQLVGALPGSVAVVVSQDGGVRFVWKKGGRVTYWEQE